MAYDQYYLLKQGHDARNSGHAQEAIQNYQDYINSHPFSQNLKSSKAALQGAPGTPTNSSQYLLRNLLIAYKNLLRVLHENGRTKEVRTWLTNLKSIYDPEGFGSKNSYNLAVILQENNCLDDCTALLENIITNQIEEYRSGNNKVFLRAASMLMKVYVKHGQIDQQRILCNNLLQCPRLEFDNNDSYRLATLLLKEAQTREIGKQLLGEISNQTGGTATDAASILKANICLMKCKYEENDKEGLDCIASQCTLTLKNNLSPSALYKLGVAFLKYGKKNQGKAILERISQEYTNSVWSRKSLFLLGRNALSEKDWTAAIDHYSTYIDRYPEQTFFCLKAYSNILDAYWSRDGDLEQQQLQIDSFADIINQTADYETQLNMARELSYKGFEKLADSTFILGYTFVQGVIANNKNTLPAMRANWQLTKYGFEVGRFDIARDSGEDVLDTHGQIYNLLTTAKEKERADHYLSRTILWLAKLYETTREEEKAKRVLQRFVSDFPHDTDSDYATYQLGRLYEQEGQFQDAAESYRQIKKKQWRKKGRQGTTEDGCHMKSLLYSLFFLIAILFIPVTSPAWECDVTLDAPKTIKIDQEVILTADGTPTGGSYSWSRTKNLTPDGATATLIGHKPNYSEYIQVIAYYRSPKGKKCKDVKWIWVCACNVTRLNGPATAKVGQKVALAAEAEPTGGAYTWTIVSGSGSLTPDDSSAEFIGDKAGSVEIKVSYVPPDGGEPCTKDHTIEVEGECEVTLDIAVASRPICRSLEFHAEGIPTGGDFSWEAGNGISGSGKVATYDSTTPGTDTITVKYTSPDGTTCDASTSITSFSLNDDFASKKSCFNSGTSLQLADFTISTTPPGFHDEARLSPSPISTSTPTAQQETRQVTASLLCRPSTNEKYTNVVVVNKDVEIGSKIEIEIPNLLKVPLEKLGLADKLEFKLRNSYKKNKECCDAGPEDAISGETSIKAEAALKDFTLYGVPLPKAVRKYFTFNAFQADLTGKGSVLIIGESEACNKTDMWSGGGNVSVELGIGSKAKVKAPYFLVQGEVKGKTDVKESLSVDSSQITANGQWGGVVVKGTVKIRVYKFIIQPFGINHQVIGSGTTPTVTIDLPALQ